METDSLPDTMVVLVQSPTTKQKQFRILIVQLLHHSSITEIESETVKMTCIQANKAKWELYLFFSFLPC